jgi:transposase InsO family protein
MTGMPLERLLAAAGISARTWREWQGRRGTETRHNNNTPKSNRLTPDEIKAVIAFCQNSLKSHRTLCYEMIDKDIAFVSCGSVYNIIKRHKLGRKWAEMAESAKQGFDQPTAAHQHWHIDFSYIRVGGAYFYLVSILDGYSRRILNWRLCESMEGVNAEMLVLETKEQYPDAKSPRLISDNGSQFASKDFAELVSYLEFEHAFTSANHPQSNGKLERFHRTLKTEHVRRSAYLNYEDARVRIASWISYYNGERLHGAIRYLTPDDVFYGRAERRLAERREKLHTALINRQAYWRYHRLADNAAA